VNTGETKPLPILSIDQICFGPSAGHDLSRFFSLYTPVRPAPRHSYVRVEPVEEVKSRIRAKRIEAFFIFEQLVFSKDIFIIQFICTLKQNS
jgi:hypothetical protein